MQYELYLDVLLLTDFVMNLKVLFFVGKILKLPMRAGKIIGAAFLGAILHGIVLVMILKTAEPGFLITSPVIAAGMLRAAFATKNRMQFLKGFTALIAVSAMLSGLMQAANPLQRKTALCFILTVTGAYGAMMILECIYRKLRRRQGNLYSVRLYFREQDLTVTGLLDTGNRLLDPIYKKPVHILDASVVNGWISKDSELLRFHLIPYHSIGKNRGLLPAIVIPRMVVTTQAGEQEIKDAVIAVTREQVSSDGRYQMILHEECIG